MTLEDITVILDKKIAENPNKIIIKYYEMKVQQNLSNDEMFSALNLIRTRLTNLGYKVLSTDDEYEYQGNKCIVEINELLVGIKEER